MTNDSAINYFKEIFKAFSTSKDGRYCFVCDIKTDLSLWSQEAVEYFGLPSEMMKNAGQIWAEHIEPSSREPYLKSIKEIFSGKTDRHEFMYRAKNKDGRYVTCLCNGKVIRDEEGEPKFFAGVIINFEMGDMVDPITGLYSRNSLMTTLKDRLYNKKPFYLLIVGIRNFFDVNNSYGYSFGNKVLKAIADKLVSLVSGSDCFRSDGTKMAVLFDRADFTLDDVKYTYDCLRRFVRNDMLIENRHVVLDLVGGVVTADLTKKDVNSIYNSVIFAISKAKEDNRYELELYDDSFFTEDSKRLEILSKIRKAVINDCEGFFLCYQPIIDAKTNKISGMEALVRWKNEKYGLVPPNSFIPWLERDPIFNDLGDWILKRAMTDTKKIIEENPELIVNVNLAYPQLQQSNFAAKIDSFVNEIGFPPQNLKLEITERCRLLNVDMLKNEMLKFKNSGYQTALDDFGTGYSAITLLAFLPVDQIKIDRSFIMGIETDRSKQCLLKAITSCAGDLEKDLCIEGIETKNLKDYLNGNFYVNNFQGYYYSKPITIEAFKNFLKEYDPE